MTTDTIRRNRNYLEKDVQMMKNMLQALTVHTDTVAPASDDNGNHPDSSMDTETDGPGSRPDPTIISFDDEEDSESDGYSSWQISDKLSLSLTRGVKACLPLSSIIVFHEPEPTYMHDLAKETVAPVHDRNV
ncbi:hypothetical protein HYE68_006332 [Fusarium pseudograminearum]|nr:hypothetical protein HYE68_006332 [Fusarium pseudograminearum]